MTKLVSSVAYHAFRDVARELRVGNGLTQRDLARRLGVPQSFVSKYETGERRLDFLETMLICTVLGVDVEEFATLLQRRLGTVAGRTGGGITRRGGRRR